MFQRPSASHSDRLPSKISFTANVEKKMLNTAAILSNQSHGNIVSRLNFTMNSHDKNDCSFKPKNIHELQLICSEIIPNLYVGGSEVAKSKETLEKYNIQRVVNCAIGTNFYESEKDFQYLSLHMADSTDDDISWFICRVIKFIHKAHIESKPVLLHCEKGISRSCALAVAYYMWLNCVDAISALEFVYTKREIANPNVAFTAQLMEFKQILSNTDTTIVFRVAYHNNSIWNDDPTPVLKACRRCYNDRKLLPLSRKVLLSQGTFVIKAVRLDTTTNALKQDIYIWSGNDSSEDVIDIAMKLSHEMTGVFTSADATISVIYENNEPIEFINLLVSVEDEVIDYNDLISTTQIALPPITGNHLTTTTDSELISCRQKLPVLNSFNQTDGDNRIDDACSTSVSSSFDTLSLDSDSASIETSPDDRSKYSFISLEEDIETNDLSTPQLTTQPANHNPVPLLDFRSIHGSQPSSSILSVSPVSSYLHRVNNDSTSPASHNIRSPQPPSSSNSSKRSPRLALIV